MLISQRTVQTAFHKALARSFDGTQANAQGGGNLLVGLPLRCGKQEMGAGEPSGRGRAFGDQVVKAGTFRVGQIERYIFCGSSQRSYRTHRSESTG